LDHGEGVRAAGGRFVGKEDSVVGLCDGSSQKVKIIEGVIIAVVPEMECCCILSGNAHKNPGMEFLHSVSHSNESRAMHRKASTDSQRGQQQTSVALTLLSSCLTARRRHAWVLAAQSAESAQISRYNLNDRKA
jgi:hypothetical protein